MPDYQAVLSSHEISKNIADLLEDIDPIQYNGSNRARRVRNVNDYMSPTRRPVTACSVSAALLSRLPTSFPGPGPCINCGTPLPQTSEAMSKLPSN